MIPALKAEFKKVLSVRSTYVIMAFCLVALVFFAFFIEGYKRTANVTDPNLLASEITSAATALAFLVSLIGLLLMTHEYRYNTIAYTLVAAKSRLTVLAAKIVVVSIVAISLMLVISALSPLFTYIGIELKGLTMVRQTIPVWDMLWRSVFYGWGYAMLALLLAVLIRSQVGTIVALFLIPSTVESLLGLLLKENVVYLPFNALNSLVSQTTLSHRDAALVFGAYMVVGWAVAALLFLRRDAN